VFDDCYEWTRMVGWKMVDLEIQALKSSVGVTTSHCQVDHLGSGAWRASMGCATGIPIQVTIGLAV